MDRCRVAKVVCRRVDQVPIRWLREALLVIPRHPRVKVIPWPRVSPVDRAACRCQALQVRPGPSLARQICQVLQVRQVFRAVLVLPVPQGLGFLVCPA